VPLILTVENFHHQNMSHMQVLSPQKFWLRKMRRWVQSNSSIVRW